MSGSTEQTTAAFATSLSVEFQVSAIVDGAMLQWGALADLANQYTLGFTLTTASLMHLTASGGASNGGPGRWSLNGDGVHTGSSFGSFDQTFFADPGSYILTVSDTMHVQVGPQGQTTHFEQTDSLSLTADFIPEPRWTVVPLGSLLILWHFVSRRRRHA